jgi:predicted nucleotidyltransferase
MTEATSILNYLRVNKDRLMHEYHLTKLGLFGSYARHEQYQGSDIDIVIEFESDTSDLYSLKQKLKNEIQSQFDKPVDICRLKYVKPIFRNQIQRDIQYV